MEIEIQPLFSGPCIFNIADDFPAIRLARSADNGQQNQANERRAKCSVHRIGRAQDTAPFNPLASAFQPYLFTRLLAVVDAEFLEAFSMQRHEHVVEHIISHPSAQGDALRFVEGPVDAEVDSALAVLFFSL